MIEEFKVITKNRYQLIDITNQIEQVIKQRKIKGGLAVVFVPHSTAGIILTENESGLRQDWLKVLERLVSGINFSHNRIDNNADSHILSGLVNQERVLIIEDNRLVRGTWQQIFLAEFDGPRTRRVVVKVSPEVGNS